MLWVLCVSPGRDIGGEGDAVIDKGEGSCAGNVFPLCWGRTAWKTVMRKLLSQGQVQFDDSKFHFYKVKPHPQK